MDCASCGTRASRGARFCGACGTPLPPPTLAPPPGSAAAFLGRADDGATLTFSGLVAGRWEVVLPSGAAVRVEGPLLVGRRPDPARGPHGARLVTVEDPGRTVSRSHLVLTPGTNGVLATDVSGHGIVVVDESGHERRVTNASVEVVAASRIGLGRVRLRLRPG